MRKIQIGWMYRSSNEESYSQMKSPTGGIKELVLNSDHEYSVSDIVQLGIKTFTEKKLEGLLQWSEVKLGTFAGKVYENFDVDGSPGHLFKYFADKKISLCRAKLYLLSTLTDSDSHADALNQADTVEKCVKRDKIKCSTTALHTITSLPVDPPITVIDSQKDQDLQIKIEEVDEALPASTIILQASQKEVQSASIPVPTTIATAQNLRSKKKIIHTSSQQIIGKELSTDDLIENIDVNVVRLYYHYVRKSEYSDELSWVELNAMDMRLRLYPEAENPQTAEELFSINPFDPVDEGHSISRIELNDKVLLQINLDDKGERSFLVNHEDKSGSTDHYIIYDVNILHGFCNGQFGIGAIPSCTNACNPLFSWKKDGELFKQGLFLYWIYLTDDDFNSHVFQCTVTCEKKYQKGDKRR